MVSKETKLEKEEAQKTPKTPELRDVHERRCYQNIKKQWKDCRDNHPKYVTSPFFTSDFVDLYSPDGPIDRLYGKSVEGWFFDMAKSKLSKKRKRDAQYKITQMLKKKEEPNSLKKECVINVR
jgi:hypothetical protein